jgi:hypothetical protein
MSALDGAAADVEGRSEPAVYPEVFASDGGADDVDDGVDGADFVEVHILDGHGVDAGFGFAEKLEGVGCAGLYGSGEGRGSDDAEDRGERAVRLVCVIMRVLVGMDGAVGVSMFVGMCVLGRVLMLVVVDVGVVVVVGMLGFTFHDDVDLGSGEAAAHDLAHL